ncbi:hypothetical protein K474DRAFT_1192364 [Panus rudis PR-1116 ss-1]|nr:hypothetical protein K474DRAFT_1192364 [Panus rudis PR-1116 ss-1]
MAILHHSDHVFVLIRLTFTPLVSGKFSPSRIHIHPSSSHIQCNPSSLRDPSTMYLPMPNTRLITLTLLGLTLASVHVARAFPTSLSEGSLERRWEDSGSDSWGTGVALDPRDDHELSSEFYFPTESELHARFYDPVFDLEARADDGYEGEEEEDGPYFPPESERVTELHARSYEHDSEAFGDLEARYSDDLDGEGEDQYHSSLYRREPGFGSPTPATRSAQLPPAMKQKSSTPAAKGEATVGAFNKPKSVAFAGEAQILGPGGKTAPISQNQDGVSHGPVLPAGPYSSAPYMNPYSRIKDGTYPY